MSILRPNTKKCAVIICINYIGTSNELRGCINDGNNIKKFLTVRAGFDSENIQFLADDGSGIHPTKENIIQSFRTLVDKATNEGFTELWLSYSGHGSYVKDENGDEADGCDETICPVDFSKSGFIVDDLIYSELVSKLPKGVTLFGLMDCCHSGTIFDLPLIYTSVKRKNNTNSSHKASVISISGCKDFQTSADANIDGKFSGAMTWGFLEVLKAANYNINIVDLVDRMRALLKVKYSQVPMLAVSDELQYEKNMLQIDENRPMLSDDGTPMKQIVFEMTTDECQWESSWNIFSVVDNSFVFPKNKTFKSKNQTTIDNVSLKHGDYKLQVHDRCGDGGIKSVIRDGSKVLASGDFYAGKIVDYHFTVEL